MRRRRTEITIETERVLVFSRPSRLVAWCDGCGAQAEMVTADEAALIAGVSSRTVYRWVEAGRLHFAEPERGALLVCLKSLSQ